MRRLMAGTTALPLALALAGCGRQDRSNPAATATSASEAPASSESAAPDASASTRQRPAAEAGRSAALPPAIPLALRGRWGMVPADCTSTRGDAKGLITVGARELKFYESLGTLLVTKERGDDRLAGTFAYEGEGMEWRREVTLEAGAGGKVLVLRESGDDAPPGPQRYTRCDT